MINVHASYKQPSACQEYPESQSWIVVLIILIVVFVIVAVIIVFNIIIDNVLLLVHAVE
jgi:uncharacterized membrane protein YidH (DUF202 family)